MAVLSEAARVKAWAHFMSQQSAKRALFAGQAGLKNQLRLAVDAADDRLEAFVNGLVVPPVAALSDLTVVQRLELLRELISGRLGD